MSFDRHDLLARLDAEQDVINPMLPATADRVAQECAVTPGMRVLDLACGTGGWTMRFVRLGAHVDAVDIQPLFLERAADRVRAAAVVERCSFREIDAAGAAAAAVGYDAALMLGVSFLWGSMDDPESRVEAALAAGRRCVRAGGIVLFGEPHVRNPVPGYLTRTGIERLFRRLRLNAESCYDDGEEGWDHYIAGREAARRRLREETRGARDVHAALTEIAAEEEWERDNLYWSLWRLRV